MTDDALSSDFSALSELADQARNLAEGSGLTPHEIRQVLADLMRAGRGAVVTFDPVSRSASVSVRAKAAAGPAGLLRGVNLSGAEFAHTAETLPGAYGTDYSYDTAASYAYLASRGHKLVRLPFRWERLQPTRGAALNAAEFGRLKAAVAAADAVGIGVLLDLHNYARFIEPAASGGAERVLGTDLPLADFVDVWTRLSAAMKGVPGVAGYGLMNEPHDLATVPGAFSGTTRYDWSDGTVQGWTGDAATASNVGGKLQLSKANAAPGFFNLRKDDGGAKRGGALAGNVLSAVVTLAAGTVGSWKCLLQWQSAAYQWQSASSIVYTRADTGAVVSGLIAGVPVRVTADFTTNPITTPNAYAVQLEANDAAAATITATVDDFAQGALSGGRTPAQAWELASQAAVDAIRANRDATPIYVGGYNYSGAQVWATTHLKKWITDGGAIFYEAHYYFDANNSGTYSQTYAETNAEAVSKGYANLAAKISTQIGSFVSWCETQGVRGFLGEFGWPNTGDVASWNAAGEVLYARLDAAKIPATYWATGARWGTGYLLSPYTGEPLSTAKAQASVIEAHPST